MGLLQDLGNAIQKVPNTIASVERGGGSLLMDVAKGINRGTPWGQANQNAYNAAQSQAAAAQNAPPIQLGGGAPMTSGTGIQFQLQGPPAGVQNPVAQRGITGLNPMDAPGRNPLNFNISPQAWMESEPQPVWMQPMSDMLTSNFQYAQRATPGLTYNPNPGTNIPGSTHDPLLARAAGRMAQ